MDSKECGKSCRGLMESLPGHSYGGTEKNHKDTQRSPADILIGSNPNTNTLMSAAN
jgi:hypothetical protein